MLQAQATLAYGLTVRAIDLYLVADGWHRLTAIDKTLSFIDLVCLRRQRGSLVVSTTSKIAQVPVEIWIKVREWLVLEAVADSQNRKLHEILCINHSGQDVSDRLTISELHGLDCGQCLDGLYESCFTLHDRWIDPAELKIDQLLSAFGLACPTQPLITESGWVERLYLALVAAPSRFVEQSFGHPTLIKATHGGNQEPVEHSLIDVSVDLPPNIDKRITRFIRLFNLEVYDGSVNKLVSTGVDPLNGSIDTGSSREARASGVRDEVAKEIKPRWKLWTACDEM